MLVRDLLIQSSKKLEHSGCDAPRLNAELLLMHAWHCSRIELITRAQNTLPDDIQSNYTAILERRLQHEPLAYIIGEKEFWSRRFTVNPDVLIPRPETEHLIDAVLTAFPDRNQPWHFCDIGTGSGCIAVTLACEYPQTHVTATDISPEALAVAEKNAIAHHVQDRITFLQGDMLAPLNEQYGSFDGIISNPPYVAISEISELAEELSFEPRHALTDEADGLHYLQSLADSAAEFLKTQGMLIVETGPCGLPKVPATLQLQQHIHDLAGHLRGASYRKLG